MGGARDPELGSARPRPLLHAALVLAAGAAAVLALDWDLSVLVDTSERARALERLGAFLAAFAAPDLSRGALARGAGLALETLAIAWLGTALAVLIAVPLGLAASRAVLVDGEPPRPRRWPRRALVELARLALDVLRGVPDFAWALLILTVPGPGAVTGVLALGVSNGGILGKVFSELWDSVDGRRAAPARDAGAGRLATFLYGLHPRTARAALSFTLMRWECSVRNASVIGVVGGGGLGGELFERLGYGRHAEVATLLGFLIALTAATDLASNLARRQLRVDPHHPRSARPSDLGTSRRRRRSVLAAAGLGTLLALLWLAPALARAGRELGRVEGAWIAEQLARLARPDLSGATLLEALAETRVPLAVAVLGTLAASAIAGLTAFPASVSFQLEPERFSGERAGPATVAARRALLLATRAALLTLRALPEVGWVLLLAAVFRMGVLPGVLAMALHSGGVLGRVFSEAVDDLPHREHARAFLGSRAAAFLYSALPGCRRAWWTYAAFQLEVNLRMGLVLGIVGVGGLGDRFHTSLSHWNLERAGTFLLAMVLLTVAFDRLARAAGRRGVRPG